MQLCIVGININCITATIFAKEFNKANINTISMYEVEQLINLKMEERKLGGVILELLELDIMAELDVKLPYKGWVGLDITFFSKAATNTLSPNYPRVDHKIVLIEDIYCLKSCPLYPIIVEHLELLHTYIQENL